MPDTELRGRLTTVADEIDVRADAMEGRGALVTLRRGDRTGPVLAVR
jgi:hypothetical protein